MNVDGMRPTEQRRGIAAGGHWIVDHVKVVDVWPDQDTISIILEQKRGTGGCPYNLLQDLSKMGRDFPLYAFGLLGDDADGRDILEDCRASGVDCSNLKTTREAPTSCTDVITVRKTGRRTFFHHPGTNALLNVEHIDLANCGARIFQLGYLALLETLDQVRADGQNGHQVLLSRARALGMITSADVASQGNALFSSIIKPCLPHLDFLFMNEIEAMRLTGRTVQRKDGVVDFSLIEEMAKDILAGGIGEAVVIHMRDGAVAACRDGNIVSHAACLVPADYIKGAAGAGDAFGAGFLFGVHEGWKMEQCLELATCAAAVSLGDVTCAGAIQPWQQCLDLGGKWGFGTF